MSATSISRLPLLTLGIVWLFTLVFFLFAHEGLYDYDDFTYARYAYQLAAGTFDFAPPPGPDHTPLHQRYLIFGPVAVIYRVLGVGIFTTTLWPLLCTLGTSLIIYLLYHRRAPVVASAAMLLLGLHYFTLNLSTYLYPDNVLMFFAVASAAALLLGRRAERQRAGWWGAFFALLNLAALLSKETIIYYLPFYLGVLGLDKWHRRHGRFWGTALGVGAVLLAAYYFFFYRVANDGLYPFQVIEYTNDLRRGSNYSLGHGNLLARLTYQPLEMLIGTGLAAVLLLALLSFSQSRRLDADGRFWLALAGSALTFYWVGSTSLIYYNPNSLSPRMITPLLPPLCLAAGVGLAYFTRTGRGGWGLALSMLAGAVWLRSSISIVYGLLGSYFVVATLARRHWRFRPGSALFTGCTLAALGLITAIRPAYFMRKPTNSGYFAQQRLLDQQELRGPAGGLVLMDRFSLQKCAFFYQFRVPAGLEFRLFSVYDTLQPVPGRPVWLLINRPLFHNDELVPRVIPYSVDQVLAQFPNRQLKAQDTGVELYLLR